MTGDKGMLSIDTKNALSSHTSYILMILSLVDEKQKEVTFEDGIFDFSTSQIVTEDIPVMATNEGNTVLSGTGVTTGTGVSTGSGAKLTSG